MHPQPKAVALYKMIVKKQIKIKVELYLQTGVTCIIIYMKKLLDSDWLRAVQFKCNTTAKSEITVQITQSNSGL